MTSDLIPRLQAIYDVMKFKAVKEAIDQMQQGTPEWLDARKGRVTGSSVGAILGLSPFRTRDDVMRQMVCDHFDAPSEFTGNIATEYGNRHEDGAKIEYEMVTGNKVINTGFHTFEGWLGASPDGFIDDDGLVEIKCPFGLRNADKPSFKNVFEQPHYFAQMQIQMFVTNRKWCDFFQWTPKETYLERVEIDPHWLKKNLAVLKDFYDEYVHICSTRKLYIQYLDGREELDAAQMLAEYDDMEAQIKEATERKKELLAKLVELSGNRDALINGRKLTFVSKKGAVSYGDMVKELLPNVDVEPYRGKPVEYWMLGK